MSRTKAILASPVARGAVRGLPPAIRIGYRTYRLFELESLGDEVYGQESIVKGKMTITPGLDTETLINTLIHEVMHAILSVWREGEKMLPEPVVCALANGWHVAWRDNPDLMTWLHRHITEERTIHADAPADPGQ